MRWMNQNWIPLDEKADIVLPIWMESVRTKSKNAIIFKKINFDQEIAKKRED